jgi:hypothetical protein
LCAARLLVSPFLTPEALRAASAAHATGILACGIGVRIGCGARLSSRTTPVSSWPPGVLRGPAVRRHQQPAHPRLQRRDEEFVAAPYTYKIRAHEARTGVDDSQ